LLLLRSFIGAIGYVNLSGNQEVSEGEGKIPCYLIMLNRATKQQQSNGGWEALGKGKVSTGYHYLV
jgi:hypothetical protein